MAVVSTGCKIMASTNSTRQLEVPQNMDPSLVSVAYIDYNTWATVSTFHNLPKSSIAEEPTSCNPSLVLHPEHCRLKSQNCSSCFCNIGSLWIRITWAQLMTVVVKLEVLPGTLNKDCFASTLVQLGAYTKSSGLLKGSVMAKQPEVPMVAWASRVSYHLLRSQSSSCFEPSWESSPCFGNQMRCQYPERSKD